MGVDQVHRLRGDPAEEPLEHRARDELGVAPAHLPRHLDLHPLDIVALELDAEAAEQLGQREERPLLGDRLAVSHRDVHRVLDQLPVAEGDELARHVHRHVHLRLQRIGAEMRRHHHPRMGDEALDQIGDGRLLRPHVHRRSRQPARLQRGEEIALVDDAAARAVHQPRAGLEQRQLARGEEVLGLRRTAARAR